MNSGSIATGDTSVFADRTGRHAERNEASGVFLAEENLVAALCSRRQVSGSWLKRRRFALRMSPIVMGEVFSSSDD